MVTYGFLKYSLQDMQPTMQTLTIIAAKELRYAKDKKTISIMCSVGIMLPTFDSIFCFISAQKPRWYRVSVEQGDKVL